MTVIFLVDLITCINDNAMASFCSLNDLASLIDQPTCYKIPDKATCIDLILTNRPKYFQQNDVIKTSLSRFHMMVLTELKMGLQKLKPHIVAYRDYKNFDNENLLSDIESCASEKSPRCFKDFFFVYLTSMLLLKENMSQLKATFMTKELHKAIMKKSRLRNKFLKSIIDRKNYNVQRELL